jgi:hypothetical protein
VHKITHSDVRDGFIGMGMRDQRKEQEETDSDEEYSDDVELPPRVKLPLRSAGLLRIAM